MKDLIFAPLDEESLSSYDLYNQVILVKAKNGEIRTEQKVSK